MVVVGVHELEATESMQIEIGRQDSAIASFCFLQDGNKVSPSALFTRGKSTMQQHTRYSLSFRLRLSTSAAALALLAACGGGDSSSSIGSAGGGATGSGGSTNGGCNYPDKITASERQQANSCGIQVSGAYGAADARLQQIIQACQLGEKAAADADYAGPYTKLVNHARDNAKALNCGGNNGPTLPDTSSQTYYNLCGKTSSTMKYGVCYGPVKEEQGGCGSGEYASYTYMSKHTSSSACITARDKWLNSR